MGQSRRRGTCQEKKKGQPIWETNGRGGLGGYETKAGTRGERIATGGGEKEYGNAPSRPRREGNKIIKTIELILKKKSPTNGRGALRKLG